MYGYPWSLAVEGVDRVLDDLQERAGCERLVVAFNYHTGKFLHLRPHPHFHFTEPATAYFRPTPSRYGKTPIRPVVSELARSRDVLAEARRATRKRGMQLHAWVICLHSTVLGALHPETVVRTAFDDPLPFALSPSHPHVREYLCAMMADIVARYEPDRIELESIEYVPTDHGYHHELDGVALDTFHRALLGIDFSEHARADLAARGVDVERACERVRARLADLLQGRSATVELDQALAEEPEIRSVFDARLAIIADLVREVRQAAQAVGPCGVDVILSPWSRPARLLWLEGHSPRLLAEAADRLVAPLYFADPGEIASELAALECELGGLDRVTGILLLLEPVTPNEAALRAALDKVRAAGLSRLNFYNHAFVRLETLDWIRAATSSEATASPHP